MLKIHTYIIVFIFTLIGNAQNSFIVKDVKVFDGETVILSTSVKVKDGFIVEVSKHIKAVAEDVVIDGDGKTLMPALSNAHVHAWVPQSLTEAAKAGVLNVMDMHGMEAYQTTMRQLKDSTNYARYFVAGYAATAPDGHGTQFGFPVPTLTKPEDAKTFIKDRVAANVDHIKIILEPWKNTLSIETVAALIREAHIVEKIAVVHISRLEDAINVITNDADGLVHIWWDKPLDEVTLNDLSESKSFFVIPTLLTTIKSFESMGEEAKKFLSKEQLLTEVKKMHNAGIPILAGTDPPNLGINYGVDLYKELELLSATGMSNTEVLKTATSNITKAFGLENSGFIKAGYNADLIVIEGDVIEDLAALHNTKMIWKMGKRVH